MTHSRGCGHYVLMYVYEIVLYVYFVTSSFIRSVIFFFKQKTAYEMLRSLVGSEMCIRDRNNLEKQWSMAQYVMDYLPLIPLQVIWHTIQSLYICLLYTSDAADDLLCVDLGGRRIIKTTN